MQIKLPSRFGYHLDALVHDGQVLDDELGLDKLIRELAKDIGMNILTISSAHIDEKKPDDDFHEDGGYSIQALITTSHIALHVWPKKKFFMFDVVSCRSFDPKQVNRILLDCLKVKDVIVEYYNPYGFVCSDSGKYC